MTLVIGDSSNFTRDMVLKTLDTADTDTLVRVLTQLGEAGEEKAAELRYADAVAAHLDAQDEYVIASAATALGHFGSQGVDKGGRRLAELSHHPSSMVRIAVAESFGNLGPLAKQHAKAVSALVRDKESLVRVVALHALGDMEAHSEAAVAAAALEDSCPEVVSAACDALSSLGQVSEETGSSLVAGLRDGRTRFSALSALVDLGDKAPAECAAGVAECLADADSATRSMAVAACIAGVPRDEARVLELLHDERPGARAAAATSMGEGAGLELGLRSVEAIAGLLKDPVEDESQLPFVVGGSCRRLPPYLRRPQCAALVALGKLGATGHSSDIAALLGHPHYEVRCCALQALGDFGAEGCEWSGEIAALLSDSHHPVRAKACDMLGLLGLEQELQRLVDAFKDGNISVRESAVAAVGALGDAALGKSGALVELLGDEEPTIRAAAVRALSQLGENAHAYAGVIAMLLRDEDVEVRVAVLEALPRMGDHGRALAAEMAEHLFEKHHQARAAAKQSMRDLGDAGEPFLQYAQDE